MTIQEVSQRIGKSQSTIRRWIKENKLEAKLVDGIYDIPESAVDEYLSEYPAGGQMEEVVRLQKENDRLVQQYEEAIQEAREIRKAAAEAQQRSDTIILQLTRQLELAQQPFWRRWRRRKQLPEQATVILDEED